MKKSLKKIALGFLALVLPCLSWATVLPQPAWTWDGSDGTATDSKLSSGETIYTITNHHIKDLSSLNIRANNFTYSFWVCVIKNSTSGTNWDNYGGFSTDKGHIQIQRPGTNDALKLYPNATFINETVPTATFQTSDKGDLELVTIVSDDGYVRVYVNGVSTSTVEVDANLETGVALSLKSDSTDIVKFVGVGGCPNKDGGGVSNNKGNAQTIADARIYSQAFTADEVKELYDDYATRAAANRVFTGNGNWSDTGAWKYGENQFAAPEANADAAIYIKQDSTITMNAAANVGTLKIDGFAKATFGGEKELTASTTTINTDTDVSAITASLGDVTIADGKKLTIGENMAEVLTSVNGDGTLEFVGGTEETPLAYDKYNFNIAIAKKDVDAPSYVKVTSGGFTSNQIHKIIGDDPDSSYLYLEPNKEFGFATGTTIKNVTLIHSQTDYKFWWERGNFDGTILKADAEVHLNNFSPAIAGLEGSGSITQYDTTNKTLTLDTSATNRETTFSGRIRAEKLKVVVKGDGKQAFSGDNNYTLGTEVLESATLAVTGDGKLGSGAVTVADGATIELASSAGTISQNISGEGTVKTMLEQDYSFTGTLPEHLELYKGTINFGTHRFPHTEVKLSEDAGASATINITITAAEITAGFATICKVPYAELPVSGLTITPVAEAGATLPSNWSLRVTNGTLIMAAGAADLEWSAADWTNFKPGDNITFVENNAATIEVPEETVAGTVTVNGAYTFTGWGDTLAATSIAVGANGALTLQSMPVVKYVRLRGSRNPTGEINSTATDNDVPGFAELILMNGATPIAWPLGTTIVQKSPEGAVNDSAAWTNGEHVNALIDGFHNTTGSASTPTNPATGNPVSYSENPSAGANKWWPRYNSTDYAVITLGEPLAFDGYQLISSDYQSRNAQAWTIDVSVDGTTWYNIETITNQTLPTSGGAFYVCAETESTTFPVELPSLPAVVSSDVTVNGTLSGCATIAGDVTVGETGAIVVNGTDYLTIDGALSGTVKFKVPNGTILAPLAKVATTNWPAELSITDMAETGSYEATRIDGVYYASNTAVTSLSASIAENTNLSEIVWGGDGLIGMTYPFLKAYSCTLSATQAATVTMDMDATFPSLTIGEGAEVSFAGAGDLTVETTTTVNGNLDVSGVTGTVGLGAVTVADGKILTINYSKETKPYTTLSAPNGSLRVANNVEITDKTEFTTGAGTWIVGAGTTTSLPANGRIQADLTQKLKVEGTFDVKAAWDVTFDRIILGNGSTWTNSLDFNGNGTIDTKKQYPRITLESGEATISGKSFASVAGSYAAQSLYLNGGTLNFAMGDGQTFYAAAMNIQHSEEDTETTAGTIKVSSGTLKFFNANNMTAFAPKTHFVMNGGTLLLANRDYEIGSLAGSGNVTINTINNSKTLTVGALGGDTTYSGTFTGPATVTKVGSGTLTLAGNNTATWVTLNVNDGKVAITNAYQSPIVVAAEKELILGAGANVTNAVTINGSVKSTGNASMSGALTGSGTITVESGTLDLTGATIANTLKLEVSGEAIVIVTKEQLEAFATITTAETATIKIPADNMSMFLVGAEISATLSAGPHAIAGAIQVGETDTTYTYADNLLTVIVPANPTMTGSNWWWDYEFNGNGDNIGSDGVNLSWDGDRPLKNGAEYTEADSKGNKMLKLPARPWRGVEDWPTEATFVMYTKAGATANGVLASFGSSDHGTKQAITLAVGATPDTGAMRLVHTSGMNLGTDLVSNFSVPNSKAAYHLYAFAMYVRDEKTHIDVYVDGALLTTYTFNSVINLGPGFQIASIHGGYANTGLARLENDDTATMDFLRVADEVLTPAAMEALANAYPYTSPSGRATRTVAAEDTVKTWIDGEGQTVWTQTTLATDGSGTTTDTPQVAPNDGTNVALTVSDTTALAVNVAAEGVTYESLTVSGSGALTLSAVQDAGMITVSGMTEIETNVIVAADVLKVGTVNIADGKTLTFDYSAYDFSAVFEPMIPLTGLVTGAGSVAVTFPQTRPAQIAGWQCVKDAGTGEYSIVITYVDTLTAAVLASETAWDNLTWTVDEVEIATPADDDFANFAINLTVAETATLSLDAPITVKQATITGEGTLTLYGSKLTAEGNFAAEANVVAGTVTLTAANYTISADKMLTYACAGDLTVPAISGAGTFVKTGTANATISKDTTYTNKWQIAEGKLLLDNGEHATAYQIEVLQGATLGLEQSGIKLTSADAMITLRSGATMIARNGNSAGAIINAKIKVEATATDEDGVPVPAVISAGLYGDYTDFRGDIQGKGVLKFVTSDGNQYNVSGVISDESNTQPLRVIIGTTALLHLKGVNTYTGGTEVLSNAKVQLDDNGVIGPSDLTVNGSLTGNVSIAAEKSLSGSGTITGTVTFANTAVVDATAGVVTVNSVALPETGTVTVNASDYGTVLKATSGLDAAKFTATNGILAVVVGEPNELVYTVEITTPPADVTLTSNALTQIANAAAEAGVMEITSIVGAKLGTADDAPTVDVAGLELFEDIPVEVDLETRTATIKYAFGITAIRLEADGRVTVTATVSKITDGVATLSNDSTDPKIASGVTVELYCEGVSDPIGTTTLTDSATTVTITSDGSILGGLNNAPSLTTPLTIKVTNTPQQSSQQQQ